MWNREMRLFVFYDLPITKKEETKEASTFRKKLIKYGFVMMQYSIYVKFCINYDQLNKYILLVKEILPKKGNVRILKITDNQYQSMEVILGEKSQDEENSNDLYLEII